MLRLAFWRRLLGDTSSFPNFLLDQPPSFILFSIRKEDPVTKPRRLLFPATRPMVRTATGWRDYQPPPPTPPPAGICKTSGFQVRGSAPGQVR